VKDDDDDDDGLATRRRRRRKTTTRYIDYKSTMIIWNHNETTTFTCNIVVTIKNRSITIIKYRVSIEYSIATNQTFVSK
jgi:predicted transcriptional regulator of viral defense system